MGIGKVKLDSNILNQFTQKNFETFMDGVGKPISKNELIGDLDLNKFTSPLINDILNYSNTTLEHLTEEVKKNKLINSIEKTLNSIGKAIGAVVTGIKDMITGIVKMGYNTLSKVLSAVSNFIKNNKFVNMIKKAIGVILGVLGLSLNLIGKIVSKVTSLISKGLNALGLKNKFKNKLTNKLTSELDTLLHKCIDKACTIGILSELTLENNSLYNTSKKLINSSNTEANGYKKVMSSFKYIINSNMRPESEYTEVYKRLDNEYKNKYNNIPPTGFDNIDDEEFYTKYIMNMPNYKNIMSKLPIIDESRGWMNYDPDFLKGLSIDELIELSKNPKIKSIMPNEGITDKTSSYFNTLTFDKLNNYEKMIIYSEYRRSKYYAKNKTYKNINGSVVKFDGFTTNTELPKFIKKEYEKVKKDKITSL